MYITVHEPEGAIVFKDEVELNQFASDKMIIEAAGGMVFNTKGELLMMKRRGKWDMPKGKLDEGESIEECAIREVMEETGLTGLKSVKKLQTTYHTYAYKGNIALKPSHWFLMEYSGIETPIPQTEEDITEICWVDKKRAEKLIKNAFPSIREMIEKYFLS
jgi:8-oxo-dGTP pyrophosphatase MutT (NUDIX family)